MEINKVKFKEKEKCEIPKGDIISKEVSICVEEIDNGFLVIKKAEIQYKDKDGNIQYAFPCKKCFCKENPLQIKDDIFGKKYDV